MPKLADASAGHVELFPVPTLGSVQCWNDEHLFYDWRIQRNALTGHCRLLDGQNRRLAWGSFDQCKTALAQIGAAQQIPPMHGKVVLVLHGLFGCRGLSSSMANYLREKTGWQVITVGYASGLRPLSDHAASLDRILRGLEGVEEIDIVAHSLGNIVVRHYLGDQTDPKRGRTPDPRILRIVMITPPNHGAIVARGVSKNFPGVIDTIDMLGQDWNRIEPHLATPTCPFGIIAGGRGDEKGFNPLLPGDDDGLVTVASTRLEGAADYNLLPVSHWQVMFSETAKEQTLRFLQHGYFTTAAAKRPIPVTVAEKTKPAGGWSLPVHDAADR